MIKRLIKMFMKPATLARYAAEGVQKLVNESGRTEQIAKYGSVADAATELQKWLTEMLKDGRIDELERDELAARLEPLFDKIIKLV